VLEDGFFPSEKLRSIEIEANELFDAYRELYYEGGTSSVYLWDLEGGFAGCFLIKKRNRLFLIVDHFNYEIGIFYYVRGVGRSFCSTGLVGFYKCC